MFCWKEFLTLSSMVTWTFLAVNFEESAEPMFGIQDLFRRKEDRLTVRSTFNEAAKTNNRFICAHLRKSAANVFFSAPPRLRGERT
jgi:hypothetical protein